MYAICACICICMYCECMCLHIHTYTHTYTPNRVVILIEKADTIHTDTGPSLSLSLSVSLSLSLSLSLYIYIYIRHLKHVHRYTYNIHSIFTHIQRGYIPAQFRYRHKRLSKYVESFCFRHNILDCKLRLLSRRSNMGQLHAMRFEQAAKTQALHVCVVCTCMLCECVTFSHGAAQARC
jgi:hypothetical protein